MLIEKNRRQFFLSLFGIIFFGSFLTSMALNFFWKDIQVVNELLHSSLEAFGGMAAISMALLLLLFHQDGKREKGEYFLLSMGFFMMGILDTFHAVSVFGNGFFLLRSLGSVFGSIWFALVWLPGAGAYISKFKSLPLVIAFISFLIGTMILKFRDIFPLMIVQGEFTPFAILINILSGVFLITTAFYFFLEFLRSSRTESYLFACMFILFGLSAVEFPLSKSWSEDWWFWHVQRCLAYVAVLYFIFRTFLRVYIELKIMNEQLEHRVAERTLQLSTEVAERRRYAIERDKVIVELQDAVAQIDTLTGLLPTCASCKKIQNSEGNWEQMEFYIQKHSSAKFSHGICPSCAKELYPDIYEEIMQDGLSSKPLI